MVFQAVMQKPLTDREIAAKRASEKYSPPVIQPLTDREIAAKRTSEKQ